jgi:hypothetical protein
MMTRRRLLISCLALLALPAIAATPGTKPELLLFTLPGCTSCALAKQFLAQHKIPYQEHDLTTPDGSKIAEALDIPLMAPVFAFKNRTLRGFTPTKLTHFLQD